MSPYRAQIGMCFDRTFPPPLVMDIARRLDEGGAEQLWIVEDCFFTAGVSLAASALAVTERLRVGLGILPAVARNPAITAMEIATLCGLAPGRVLPGIGHGVPSWMAQMGARPPSPLTTLEEVLVVVRRLLAGERVTSRASTSSWTASSSTSRRPSRPRCSPACGAPSRWRWRAGSPGA